MLKKFSLLVLFITLVFCPLYGQETPQDNDLQGFLRYPHINGDKVVFTSEGDLWIGSLNGGPAYRITVHEGEERFAHFSPDGKWIAFSGEYDGNEDVYIVSSQGGEPVRLTYHPSSDYVTGWTEDSSSVIYISRQDSPHWTYRAYSVNIKGGYPQDFPLDQCTDLSFEPEGDRIAFNRVETGNQEWKRYKGGFSQDIWVGNTSTLEFSKVTDFAGTDAFPMWYKDRIFFLSDRGGRPNIFSMDPSGKDIVQHTFFEDYDVRWPSLGDGFIAYQHAMDIWLYDIEKGENRKLDIELPSDRLQSRSRFVFADIYLNYFSLSPDGKRVVIETRGELLTVPTGEKGLIKRLTFSSGSREKFPSWSPDSKYIAALSDSTGEEEIFLYPADGKGEARQLTYGEKVWHFPPVWSPDNRYIAFSDKNLVLYIVEVLTGSITEIDNSSIWEINEYTWSPDSRWLAYTVWEDNWNRVIKIYDREEKKNYVLTDSITDSFSPSFSSDGKYLYFLSDLSFNPYENLSMFTVTKESTVPCFIMLGKDELSPFAPEDETLEEKEEEETEEESSDSEEEENSQEEEEIDVKIDFDGIKSRVVQLPVEPGYYSDLKESEGMVYYLSTYYGGGQPCQDEESSVDLHMFDMEAETVQIVASGLTSSEYAGNSLIEGYTISDDGSTVLLYDGWSLYSMSAGDIQDNSVGVDIFWTEMEVDIKEEWKQIFNEAWRLERDFFYDPAMHGVNWEEVKKQYEVLIPRISTRDELNDLIGEMAGELNASHIFVGGGDYRSPFYISVAMLGARILPDSSGYYRVEKIYRGDLWSDTPVSPLEITGVKEGEYILAIDGRPLSSKDNYLRFLLNKTEEYVSLTVNTTPSFEGARDVIIEPLWDESDLIYMDWVREKREFVQEQSGDKIAYIHLPDMEDTGLSMFMRYYSAANKKEGLIIDVRYNDGGHVAPMLLSLLKREVWAVEATRNGGTDFIPYNSFNGHIAVLCNEETASDGETFAEGTKKLNLGKLIGKRTWGGWIGIRMDKPFTDYGILSIPEFPGWDMEGKWLIEGHGVDPDIEIENDPASVIKGGDPQLEYAIKYLLEKIEKEPLLVPEKPEYPER